MNVRNLVYVCQILYFTNFSLIMKLLDFYFDSVCFIWYFREHLLLSGAFHHIFRNSLCNNTCHITCVHNRLVRTDCHFFPFSSMDSLGTQLGRGRG